MFKLLNVKYIGDPPKIVIKNLVYSTMLSL